MFHNLGFDHSSKEGIEYGDTSGIMGCGNYFDDDRKCLNGAKSWYTGWYSAGHVTLDPIENFFAGQIVGVAEFDKRGGKKCLSR